MVKGSIGYASQEAWVFSATLRDNILFGLPYDSDKYESVIEACALEKDIELLPEGDLTLVGERGVTLSGGQKARVNLARAVYRQADVYLLDDPLSAVDAAVSRHLFERCICGILSDKIVILVTHQVQYLERCDAILGLNEGRVLVYGNARDVLKEDSGIFELLVDDTSTSDDGFKIRKQSISTGLEPQTLVTFEQKLSSLNEDDDDHEKDNSVEQSQEEVASLKKISSTDT
ncbi:PREDICTED: multidrug resistance-associated protein 4-like, partial [Amphimedon queenslandica]|uniref:ABC transporter domain-containing protein n=1 Tax=Amphimedon queenslandica TaxID=400682 RepID=A0A1X7SPK3_AMPQE